MRTVYRRYGQRPEEPPDNLANTGKTRIIAPSPSRGGPGQPRATRSESVMSKGMDQKKQEKKKPAKSLKEKRAEKRDKKSEKGFAPT